MNVATFKLCKELFELSGWVGTDKGYTKYPAPAPLNHQYKLENGHAKRGAIPAYDLGYLLRKLPPVSKVINCSNEKTQIYGALFPEAKLTLSADTPEDAAAKLAIELFKQGILK